VATGIAHAKRSGAQLFVTSMCVGSGMVRPLFIVGLVDLTSDVAAGYGGCICERTRMTEFNHQAVGVVMMLNQRLALFKGCWKMTLYISRSVFHPLSHCSILGSLVVPVCRVCKRTFPHYYSRLRVCSPGESCYINRGRRCDTPRPQLSALSVG